MQNREAKAQFFLFCEEWGSLFFNAHAGFHMISNECALQFSMYFYALTTPFDSGKSGDPH